MKKDDKEKHNTENDALQKKCIEYLDGWKRAQADYQNLLKETAKSRCEYVKYANENLIMEILPILDNFKLAFNQIPEAEKNSAWVVGFQHIKKQLEELLKSNNCEEIKTVGHLFNPLEHEAMEQCCEADQPDNIVVQEKKAGYKLNNKVVQAAKVIVNNITNKNELSRIETNKNEEKKEI